MQYLKKNTKFAILSFLVIILAITISTSTFAKTEVYFSQYDHPFLLPGSYNWTFSANHRNDENLMVIDDPDTIARFQNYFEKLWFDKYSPQRTRLLYQKVNISFPDSLQSNPQFESNTININTATQAELIKVFRISEPLAQKIINFPFMSFPHPFMSFPSSRESINSREEMNCFKGPKDLLQIPELTNIDLREWEEEGILINFE